MIQLQTLNRRGFLVSSLASVIATHSVARGQTPVATPSRIADILPAGMLDSATVPPEYKTYVTHSTLQAPAAVLDDSCVIKVYPNARRTQSAVSVVMRSADLTQSPNHFVVQKVIYRTDELAASEYRFMCQEIVDVLAGMLIRQPQFAATDDPENQKRRFEYIEPNGFNYALQIELIAREIHVVRAGGFGEPDWAFVDRRANWLRITELDALQRLDSHDGWIVSYGPIDFHPDAYQAPDCFGP